MKTLIAIPCMDEIDVGFVQSLMDLQTVGETKTYFMSGSLIYEARERLASMAVNNGFDHILWLDSDQMFKPTLMIDFASSDKDMVTGVIPMRRPPASTSFPRPGKQSSTCFSRTRSVSEAQTRH